MPPVPARIRPLASYAEVSAWLAVVDPEVLAAAADVDSTLSQALLLLSPRERLDRAVATQRWVTKNQSGSATRR